MGVSVRPAVGVTLEYTLYAIFVWDTIARDLIVLNFKGHGEELLKI